MADFSFPFSYTFYVYSLPVPILATPLPVMPAASVNHHPCTLSSLKLYWLDDFSWVPLFYLCTEQYAIRFAVWYVSFLLFIFFFLTFFYFFFGNTSSWRHAIPYPSSQALYHILHLRCLCLCVPFWCVLSLFLFSFQF